MFAAQWEFEFYAMKPTPRTPKFSSFTDRDRRAVELRRLRWPYSHIARELGISGSLARKIVWRDAPELIGTQEQQPKTDPRTKAQLLALPSVDEPLANIGIHFWDMPDHGKCKFIVARDPDDKMTRHCGENTVTFGCSWCEAHLRIVAQPKKQFVAEAA